MLSAAGPVKLDERTVTKLDFGLLGGQLETQQGSGGVRGALLDDGLATGGRDERPRGGRRQRRDARPQPWPTSPASRTSTTGGWRCWWTAGSWASPSTCSSSGRCCAARRGRRGAAATRWCATCRLAGALSLIGWIIGSIGPSTAIHFAPMWIMFGLGMGALVLRPPGRPSCRGG